jgi:hypothetical protein
MSNNYFYNFGTIEYNNIESQDIFKRIDFDIDYMKKNNMLEYYKVKNGELPEDVAFNVYNDKKLYWLILKTNNMQDYFYDWPLTDDELKEHMTEYYEDNIEKILDLAIIEYIKENTGADTPSEIKEIYLLDPDDTNYDESLVDAINDIISTIRSKIYILFYQENDRIKYINVIKPKYLNEILNKVKST